MSPPGGAVMYIESEDKVDHPADEVYVLVRDHLVDLLPYLPDVESVKEISRKRESDTRVRVVNEWKARAQVPSIAQKFLPPNLFTWTDRALWLDDQKQVEYKLEGFGYDVVGKNSFGADGKGTRLRITAEITIH